jgi:endothelin-converting enzyme/putative endopeptidase
LSANGGTEKVEELRDSVPRLVLCFAALTFAAAQTTSTCPPGYASPTAISSEFAPQGINASTISKTIRPGDDFFSYMNEGWVNGTKIPDGHWDYGQTDILGATVDARIKGLVAASVADPSQRGSPAQQVGDLYGSLVDTSRIEQRGLKAVQSDLKHILSSTTTDDIARWMADPTSSSLFAINLFPAERVWRVHLDQLNLSQPILGLPNRDAYERTDRTSVSNRAAYQAYVVGLFERAGIDTAQVRAAHVVALETRIAANQWDLDKVRDRRANYHPMTVEELARYAPGFPWRVFLKARGVSQVSDIVLGTDTAVQAQARLFAATPVDDWRSYVAFHWLQNQIDVLPEAFRQSNWAFYGQTLSNAKSPPSREDVAQRLVNSRLGQQVGRLYAGRYISEETRAAGADMINYLRKALEERLANAAWMDEATRAEALAKLANFKFKVGYPKIWRDFSSLNIKRDDAAGNLQRIRLADWTYQLRRLDPVVKDEPWYQTPQTVDASYSVLFNAIELPGAFLQPPYFDAKADWAVNFGAIGAIVGHEMAHGFDDQGIIYDSQGRMRNWWSEDALKHFHARAQALVDQYDAFSPYPGVHVNGRRTIGESIADLSGVSLAYRAYHMYLADHPCAGRTSLDGLTGDQRFFLSWAQAWRYKAPESAIRYVIEYSYHAPAQYRVNGVMQNLDAWYDAFGVNPGDTLYVPPEKRVRIW